MHSWKMIRVLKKVAGLNRVFETLNETVTEGRNTLEAQKRRRYHTYLKDIEIAWESITGTQNRIVDTKS